MKMLLFFIDGLGIGEDDSDKNPFMKAKTPAFDLLFRGVNAVVVPTDATLDTPGLPQSATGQTALLTGVNAAREMGGRHKSGFPGPTLRKTINRENVFAKLKARGKRVTFANAYIGDYLQKLRKGLINGSVTTTAVLSAGIEFRTIEQIREGEAVYQDFTNSILRDRGYELPLFAPEEAADNLARIVESNDLTLYEFFQTDIAGHSQDYLRAVNLLEKLDRFTGRLLERLALSETMEIITSDHGNIEDLSVRTHTRNRVPTFLIGPDKERIAAEIVKITDIAPAIEKFFALRG